LVVADAHRDDGKRFVVRSDEKLTAFLELEKVTRSAASPGKEERRELPTRRSLVQGTKKRLGLPMECAR